MAVGMGSEAYFEISDKIHGVDSSGIESYGIRHCGFYDTILGYWIESSRSKEDATFSCKWSSERINTKLKVEVSRRNQNSQESQLNPRRA
ncbi:hypothetical protein KPH14_003888 [Odynerus spinipes]|uniref:Uncharacterized protein n=1 Tax=Odynerus spinipes TaxID=1348599 RepID=A0AAD9RYE1_9HYME|nr:hypothetical protein KPH14_003888 [Odynerus spinipes]